MEKINLKEIENNIANNILIARSYAWLFVHTKIKPLTDRNISITTLNSYIRSYYPDWSNKILDISPEVLDKDLDEYFWGNLKDSEKISISDIKKSILNNTAIYQSDAWIYVNCCIGSIPKTISSTDLLKIIQEHFSNFTNKIILEDADTFNKKLENLDLFDIKSQFISVEISESIAKLSEEPKGYHLCDIQKGELGKVSKIREELEELEDAVLQDDKILQLCELSDLIGAIEEFAKGLGMTLEDLQKFSNKTKAAFRGGFR